MSRVSPVLDAQRVSRFAHDLANLGMSLHLTQSLVTDQLNALRAGGNTLKVADLEKFLALEERGTEHLVRWARDFVTECRAPVRPAPAAFRPASVVEFLRAALGPRARSKGLQLVLDPAPDIRVLGDRLAVERIAFNLTENAIKYTRRGRVHVRLSWSPARGLLLEVLDSGPGLKTRGPPSSGMGLAVVQELVTREGGTLNLGATAAGAQVAVTMPLRKVGNAVSDQPLAQARLVLVRADSWVRAFELRGLRKLGAAAVSASPFEPRVEKLVRGFSPNAIVTEWSRDAAAAVTGALAFLEKMPSPPPVLAVRVHGDGGPALPLTFRELPSARGAEELSFSWDGIVDAVTAYELRPRTEAPLR